MLKAKRGCRTLICANSRRFGETAWKLAGSLKPILNPCNSHLRTWSVVRQYRTPRSVGVGSGRLLPTTRWAEGNLRPYRDQRTARSEASKERRKLTGEAKKAGMITGLGSRGPYYKPEMKGKPMAHIKRTSTL